MVEKYWLFMRKMSWPLLERNFGVSTARCLDHKIGCRCQLSTCRSTDLAESLDYTIVPFQWNNAEKGLESPRSKYRTSVVLHKLMKQLEFSRERKELLKNHRTFLEPMNGKWQIRKCKETKIQINIKSSKHLIRVPCNLWLQTFWKIVFFRLRCLTVE